MNRDLLARDHDVLDEAGSDDVALDETKLVPSRVAVESIPHVVKVLDRRVILQPY